MSSSNRSRKYKQIPPGEFLATITNISHDGRGIADINGKKLFLDNALVGEKVSFKYTKVKSNYAEGMATVIHEASVDRVEPICKHFGVCGGCSLQHMNPKAQINLKQHAALEQLKQFANIVPENILPPLIGPTHNYRRKARLGVKYVLKKEKLLVGFRENNSNKLADIDSCKILHPSIGENITELKNIISSLKSYNHIAQIEIAVGDDYSAIIIRHLIDLEPSDIDILINFSKTKNLALYLQPGGVDTIHRVWPDNELNLKLYSNKEPENKLEDQLVYNFHPTDFIQVNSEINKKMLELAIGLLEFNNQDSVLDLFCGLGNFTLPISKLVKNIVGIEGVEEMVSRAAINSKLNNINNTKFYQANLEKIPENTTWAKEQFNKIILDPPRSGAKDIIPFIVSKNPEKILYISCNSATFARDAGILTGEHKYKLSQFGVMDMFPHTTHVETISLFEKI